MLFLGQNVFSCDRMHQIFTRIHMSENFPSRDIPKNKPVLKQSTIIPKKSQTINSKMGGGSERLKEIEITKNQLGALDRDIVNQNIKRF